MQTSRTLLSALLPLHLIACATEGDPPAAVDETSIQAQGFSHGLDLDPVESANPKTPGIAVPNALSPQLIETIVAQGSNALENPAAVPLGDGTSVELSHYGYNGNGPMLPAPGDVQSATHNVEAQKTEPDKNTYLVLRHQKGADPTYDYGRHFLFQGHENGVRNAAGAGVGFISRINLDADDLHRVTLFAALDSAGNTLPVFDGSTWDPFAGRLLFTAELGAGGGNNDGDNEITGIHVSNGDARRSGILGAQIPRLFQRGWRAFWTQQHGDNITWEILPRRGDDEDDDD